VPLKGYLVSTAAEAVRVGEDVDLAGVLDSFAGCFGLERASVAYVSTPITTGRRYYDWLATAKVPSRDTPAFRAKHARDVIAVNQESAHTLVLRVRHQLARVVVDPTALNVPVWTQNDYHAFWTRLITDYVGTVVFNDGWEYSTGCTIEYAAALRASATRLDAELSDLSPTVAIMKSDDAIARLRGEGRAVQDLIAARQQIKEAIASVRREHTS
jgi:hypothetical protein